MFDDLIKRLQALQQVKVSIPVEVDDAGYVDKECPSVECTFSFKVLAEDWKTLFKDEGVFCPMCRHEAPADKWFTTAQVQNANEQSLQYLRGEVSQAMQGGAATFNRRQPHRSFISIKATVTGGTPRYTFVPIPATDALELKIQCEACAANFAVVGGAFFCPCCGHNSADRTFSDALRKMAAKLDYTTEIRTFFKQQGKADEGELAVRSLIETSLLDCVGALQRFSEEMFKKSFTHLTPPFNVFQRLEEGSQLWRSTIGKGYEDWLDVSALADMKMLYQRRHLLAHNEGIVDERYWLKSGDTSYKVGQRIVVKAQDVRNLVFYTEAIANGIKVGIASVK